MDFTLDPGAQVAADLTAQLLAANPANPTNPGAAWKALADAGLLALTVPERLGGEGLDATATTAVLTEVGRYAAAVPALSTLALGVLPLVRWAGLALQDEVLPGVVSGELTLTSAYREPAGAAPATWHRDGTVSGVKIGVLDAEYAGRILVTAQSTLGVPVLLLVDPRDGGVSLIRSPSSAETPEFTVHLRAARARPIGDHEAVADLHRLALAGACAVADGALAGALALTAKHVASREQFGHPLAQFQAVSHQVADVYLTSQALHLAAVAAAWAVRATGDQTDDPEIAAYWLASRVPAAARTCHHLHGGLGLDVTYPLHRHTDLLRDLVRFVGGAEGALGRVGSDDVA